MSVETPNVGTTTDAPRLARLSAMLERWASEYPAIVAVDAARARHHIEAIADLRSLIRHLEENDVPAPRPDPTPHINSAA